MEWIIETAQTWWAEIFATTGVFLIAFKTFVIDNIVNKKVSTKFIDISSIQKGVESKVEVANRIVFDQLNDFKEKADSLLESLKSEQENNAMLSNLVVQLLSLVNVPTERKLETYNALKSIDTLNTAVMDAFKASLDSEVKSKQNTLKTAKITTSEIERL